MPNDNDMTHKWLPVIDENRCTSWGLRIEACGPRYLHIVYAIHMAWVSMRGDRMRGQWRDDQD